MTDLVVAPCSYDAAKFAVLNWHYSQAMPSGKAIKYGVWEDGRFVGAVLYGRGASKELGQRYGLDQTEVCELTRVAMRSHDTPVSQTVAATLRRLKTTTALRLVVSFADPDQGHRGGIYQAGNWAYTGMSASADEYIVNGRRLHGRSLRAMRASHPRGGIDAPNVAEWARRALGASVREVRGTAKHRYVFPLDKAMRRQIRPLAAPYPDDA